MERVHLVAEVRRKLGKEAARKLRAAGKVPAILYGRGIEPIPLAVDAKALEAVLRTAAGVNVLLDVVIRENGAERSELAMIAEVQRHLLRRDLLHVDLHRVSLEERVRARVPLVLRGEAVGVRAGGVLEQHLREVEIEALPTELPAHLEVDVGGLEVGETLHVRDIRVPAGVTVLTSGEETVVTVVAAEEAEEAAPAEGTAQPEVIRRGRAEE
ncbi:MAG: 50S ribosomal protein L25 [Armatimonadetes bacterium]|nr:50S ribosomal protein L25 [Armatimonadota bacterium]MDW8154504.1 50S ribosomal protein L25 [Armatimonadota bacterium]